MNNIAQSQVFMLLWIIFVRLIMEEGEVRWDSSHQKQYYGDNYLHKEIFQYQILWWDLCLKWKLN